MDQKTLEISISRDFSDTPGSRYRDEGKFSGQEFLEDVLEPNFKKTLEARKKLRVEVENTYGYTPGFLDASFGELVRKYGSRKVLETIKIVSNGKELEEEFLESMIKAEINGEKIAISIAEIFSVTPGSRYRDEGNFSAEEFRDDILEPILRLTLKNDKKLVVILDRTIGYATCFLEETFAGLVRNYGCRPKALLENIEIVSCEERYLKKDVEKYISEAK